MTDQFFNQTIENFKKFDEVDAIILGGSRASKWYDSTSDYDAYVFLNRDLCAMKREACLRETCKHIGLNKPQWGGNWDDCILKNGVPIEFMYRKIADTREMLENHLLKHIAWNGYTTCNCFIVFNSKILYDPRGIFSDLIKEFTMPYPEKLRKNIISENRELMEGLSCSVINQIEKAVERKDAVSVNHRIAEFVKSYFDILFAMNNLFHPGEKKLIEICKKTCSVLPRNFEENLEKLFAANGDENTLYIVREIISNLDDVLK
jgi:predicted nucleotidyltransferase